MQWFSVSVEFEGKVLDWPKKTVADKIDATGNVRIIPTTCQSVVRLNQRATASDAA